MQNIVIGLYVPALQERFDVQVPPDLKIEELAGLLAKGVTELSEGRYVPSDFKLLTQRNPDRLLYYEKTLGDYGVDNGAQLLLF